MHLREDPTLQPMANGERIVENTTEGPRRSRKASIISSAIRLLSCSTMSAFLLLLLVFVGFGVENAQAFSSSPMTTSSSSSLLALSQRSSTGSSLRVFPRPQQVSPVVSPVSVAFGSSSNGSLWRRNVLKSPFTTTTRLTTVSESQEEGESNGNKSTNVFHKAAQKFKARPVTYLIIPVIAGGVGWLTNYLAVQMIFYPVQFKGIPIWRRPEVPLGLLGWQGIVPCKTKTMSIALVEMVTSQLLTIPEAFERMKPGIVAKHLVGAVPQLGEEVIRDVVTTATGTTPFPLGLWRNVFGGNSWYSGVVNFCNVRVLKGVVKDLIKNSERIFSLENCVVDQMILDRAKLGQLFQKVGKVELEFLTNSGLWFGFLLGLIQMAVALFWDNPWALSVGGMIVGLATNWLALKWIFEPVYPTKIGPFVVQGMFLKRQKEVAAEFSKFFAEKIVTSEQIWSSILKDEATKPALQEVLGKHVKRLLSIATFGGLFSRWNGLSLPSPALIGKVTGSAVAHLPNHLSQNLHGYVDGALQLEKTLRIQMEAMSPAKFERVLHPIFEEDELTLIIAGGVLGFIAGLVQQGLETGAIKIPPLPAPIQKFLATINTKVRAALGNLKGKLPFGGGDKIDPDNGDGVSGE